MLGLKATHCCKLSWVAGPDETHCVLCCLGGVWEGTLNTTRLRDETWAPGPAPAPASLPGVGRRGPRSPHSPQPPGVLWVLLPSCTASQVPGLRDEAEDAGCRQRFLDVVRAQYTLAYFN